MWWVLRWLLLMLAACALALAPVVVYGVWWLFRF